VALLERLEIVIEADARTAEREFDRIGRSAKESLESIETSAGKAGDNAAAELAGSASKFASAGKELSDAAAKELDLSAAARGAAADVPRALDNQRTDAESAGRRLGDSAAQGVAAGVRGAGGGVRGAGSDLGGDLGDGVSGGMLDSLSGIDGDLSGALDGAISSLPAGLVGPAGAAAAVVGAAFVQGFADAIESENLGDVIAARVGAGAAESEQFARVSAGVFRDAWGESTAEVSDAVDAVYSTLADARGSEATLEDLTRRAQAFADVFNQDVGTAVSNAGVLIQTGLARDAVDAFDLMTEAAQGVPAAMRDELGEATQEYSTFFATLGFDGQEAFGILTDAAGEGRYELDKTGDAIKELSIRATDLSDVAAMSALSDLGLDARDTANDLLAGGAAARTATQDILDALSSVPEPAEQARIAIALMGAPLEDLNKAEIPEFVARLADASGGMADATGASDELTASMKNTSSAVETVKREISGAFSDYANEILQPLADYLSSEDPTLKDAANSAGEFLGNAIVDAMYLTVGGPLSLFFDLPGKQEIKDLLGIGDDPVEVPVEVGFAGGDPGLRLDPATGQLIPDSETNVDVTVGFAENGTNWQIDPTTGQWVVPDSESNVEITADGGQAIATLEDVNDLLALSGDLSDLAGDRAANYLDRIANSSGLDDMLSSALSLNDAMNNSHEWINDLSQSVDVGDIANGFTGAAEDTIGVLEEWVSVGADAQAVISSTLQFQGADAAVARAGQIRDQLVGMMDDAGYTDEQIAELLQTMGLLPEQVNTAIELSGEDEAMAKLTLLRDFYTNKDGTSGIPDVVNTQVSVAIAEGRFTDAANLISLWVKDQEDGSISDPLLIAMGLGDTAPASGEVNNWKAEEEAKPPAWIQIDANTGPARAAAAGLFYDVSRLNPKITIGAVSQVNTNGTGVPYSIPYIEAATGRDINGNGVVGRALGGPVDAGAEYMVNEQATGQSRREMFVPSTPGFVLNASDSAALIQSVQELVAGGSGVVVNQQITTADPVQAGSESARKMRDATFLAGV